jgi:hypothetical protein
MNYAAFEEENARLTAQITVMRKALVTAQCFITNELETRQDSFLPDATEDEDGYIREAKRALRAVRKALKEGK